MNKTEVLTQVSEKSGIDIDVCEQVIDEFENQFGDILLKKIKFKKNERTDIAEKISHKSNIASLDCEKVLAAFEEVFAEGLADKLKFWRK
jgi:nucleoid DNA-binding protein